MSEPARQSYYEIALTHRQVLSVFVVLLVSVLTAFLAGVWLGRRAAGPAVETVEAQTIAAATEPAEEPLERLEFFSRDGSGPTGELAEETPAQETPVEPAELESPSADSAGTAEPEPAGLVATPVASEPEPQIAASEEPPPVEEPAEEPVTTVAEAAPPAADPPAAPSQGTLVIQVFSSTNQVQAQAVVDRLRTGGFPALLSPVEVSGRTMYRVRIGPYTDRRLAEGVAEQVRRDYRLETWITE